MQNSGFGNAINPLLSLADAKIYSVPMLLLVGWRGEPGKKDEPQHLVQGKAMASMLTTCGINYEVLPDFIEGARETIAAAVQHMNTRKSPYALLVKRQCFTKYSLKNKDKDVYPLTREEILSLLLESLGTYDITVATTGFCSRELYELRQKTNQGHKRDF
jgi:phosphonopyruvate decarboxylase